MQSEMKRIRDRDWPKSLAVAMTLLALALLAFSWAQTIRLDAANARISAVAQKAFYETCELTEGMSVNLRKLLVAGGGAQAQTLLSEISRQAQGAASNLALLPMGEEAISSTLKFINQTGDFSETLSVKLASGGAVDSGDYESIAALSENAAKFSVGMANLLDRVERGEAVLDGSSASGLESLYPLTQPAAEYPTLLYDGPFSDGRRDGEYHGLAGLETVTVQQAEQSLTAFLGQASGAAFTGETLSDAPCYEFEITSGGYPMSAGVTKQGGKVLYILSQTDVTEAVLGVEELLDTARAFLLSRGFGEMEMSYYSRYDGILTVNFAAVQDGVILYPDLVKLQLSMKDGAVIGLEAGGYWRNHGSRTLPLPSISEADALARLSDRLTPLAVRLAVIPTDAGESFCYEIRATDGQDTFLVYVDATTGVQRELMQVVSDNSGAMVM